MLCYDCSPNIFPCLAIHFLYTGVVCSAPVSKTPEWIEQERLFNSIDSRSISQIARAALKTEKSMFTAAVPNHEFRYVCYDRAFFSDLLYVLYCIL